MSPTRRILLPLFLALAVVGLGVTLSACGSGEPRHVTEGEVLKLGDLEYTVLFSRYLNPNDTEDAAYLSGQGEPSNESTFFGLFLLVQNDSNEIQILPKNLTITDADGNEYEPVKDSESDFAFPFGGEVEPEEQIPVLDSPAQQGPIEGSAVIYDLPDEASNNRPLTLHVESNAGSKGEIQIDF
jgi:hypothetical protein